MAVLADSEGAAFCVWEAGDREGAQLVNEPGGVEHELPERAGHRCGCDLYGELFGWQAEAFEFGELTAFLFRLPGFVGGEPQQPVPRDVVATMIAQPADSEYQRAPADDGAHRGVDFWIGDTDAAAANAEELGVA